VARPHPSDVIGVDHRVRSFTCGSGLATTRAFQIEGAEINVIHLCRHPALFSISVDDGTTMSALVVRFDLRDNEAARCFDTLVAGTSRGTIGPLAHRRASPGSRSG